MDEVEATEESGLQLLETRLQEKVNEDGVKQFDPMIILTILSALVPLIKNCFMKTPAALRSRVGNRALLRVALRREGLDWKDAREKTELLFDLADEATDEELKGLIKDCLQ